MEPFSVFLRLTLTFLVFINGRITSEPPPTPPFLPPSSLSSSSSSAEMEKKSPGENDCPSVPDGFLNSLTEVAKVLLHQERSSSDASSSPGQSHDGDRGQLSFREGVEGLSYGRSINQRLLLSLWESEEEKQQLMRELRQTKEELLQLREKVETEREENEGDEKEPPQSRLFCPPPHSPPLPLQHLPQGLPSSHHVLITKEDLEKMKKDIIDAILKLTIDIEINQISGHPEGQKEGWPPKDCYDLFQYENVRESGVYTIYPQNASLPEGKRVWCDMGEGKDEFDQGEGGWTVILNRMPLPTQVNFTRNWEEYQRGFGNPETEYWIGNEILHLLTTSDKPQSLLVQMRDWDNVTKYAYYEEFYVADVEENFRLTVEKYSSSSTAGDSLERHNSMQFSSYDRDNDISSDYNCAANANGGFWFRECAMTTPTSPIAQKEIHHDKMRWRTFHGDDTSLMTMKMKIKSLVKN